ncbi:MAG: ATP-dependent DNA helicase [Microgenomates group bacterium GW2011_GWA2_47_8]|nr:MAG: ATP-dependent DNA helicase [Microgenomates group bacterium GW2011_GWA2_47_8]
MPTTLLGDLNPQQQKAAQETEGPVLILAGAGSGKTRVLTYRVAYLIAEKQVSPEAILMVTFTNKAAGEMKERIKNLLSSCQLSAVSSQLPFAGTFHSFCALLLRREGKYIGIPPNFSIYDEQDQLDAVKEVMRVLDISTKNFHPRAILSTISQAKNELVSATEYPQYARGYFQETVAQVYLGYQKLLKTGLSTSSRNFFPADTKISALLVTPPKASTGGGAPTTGTSRCLKQTFRT